MRRSIAALMTAVVAAGLFGASPATVTSPASGLMAPRSAGVKTRPGALLNPARDPRSGAPIGLRAQVEDALNVQVTTKVFPTFDRNWNATGQMQWRVVDGTGNCCENYLAANSQGTLFDFGGDYINFSTDQGASWRRVVPADPLPNYGEGTVAVAQNGDIVAVAWNPYFGDRVVPFKYSAEDEGWFYTTTKLHQPFFDRESVTVIPGPFEYAGQAFPYLSVLRGGAPFKSPWFYSFDGLNYFVPDSRQADTWVETYNDPLNIQPDPMRDWIQPAEQSAITPLGNGKAIARQADFIEFGRGQFARLNPTTLRWAPYEFPSGPLPQPGRLRADSKSRLHYVSWGAEKFTYRMSADGGKSWTETPITMPAGHEIANDVETAVNGSLDLLVVTVHTRREDSKTNQDLVYRFSLKKTTPKLKAIYVVGDGTGDYSSGITAPGARFDFPTIVILPDGHLAMSYANGERKQPTLAIEIGPVTE